MTETLGIFKLTEQLLMYIMSDHIVINMQKIWRHIFYPKMVEVVMDMHALMYDANMNKDKRAEYLRQYIGRLRKLELLTRVAHEKRVLTHKQADYLSRVYESLNKQATAWRNKSKKFVV